MDQLIPSLAALVEPFRASFHPQVFPTSRALLAGWMICLGPRTLSEVRQATGPAAQRHHDTADAVFHSAAWEWDEPGLRLATPILIHLIPGGEAWIVVDDTLCHKRGAKVAFGGISLDAVLSSKKHKTLRFGVNRVVLGIVVELPFRPDRPFCLPVLWRPYRKEGSAGYQTRPQAAAAPARRLAAANPDRVSWLVGDAAYVNAAALQGRPDNLQVIGPWPWKAAPDDLPGPRRPGQEGTPRKKGDRLAAPKVMIAEAATYPAEEQTMAFPKTTRTLRVQTIRNVLWDRGSKTEAVLVVLVRDPLGQWRDEALVCTDPTVSAPFVILGYCRRRSVGVAFFDGKQHLGLHDPRVRSERVVERAHPMAWFAGSLTIPWYCVKGHEGCHVVEGRPRYTTKITPTFTDMLGALRLQMWESKVYGESGEEAPSPGCIQSLLHKLAAVA